MREPDYLARRQTLPILAAPVAATAAPALQALVAEWRAINAELSAIPFKGWGDPEWKPLSKKCVALRVRIAETPARSQADFRLKLEVAVDTAGGLNGIGDELRDDLARGVAWDTTLAYSILRDLLRLPAGRASE